MVVNAIRYEQDQTALSDAVRRVELRAIEAERRAEKAELRAAGMEAELAQLREITGRDNGWTHVDDALPPIIEGTNYSETVMVHHGGRTMGFGKVWMRGDEDPVWIPANGGVCEALMFVRHWKPAPACPS